MLALVPAVCGFIGACVIGVVVPGTGRGARVRLFDGLFGAIFGYVASLRHRAPARRWSSTLLAPLFGGRKDFDSALKLAVYSYTPVWLAGIFLLLPGLRFLMLSASTASMC